MTLSVGDTFAGYRIVAVLHVTPSDAVYLVAHPTAPADEILRVYSPSVEVDVYTDDRIYGEFRQEMSAAEYLLVDGLAAIHRVGRTDGRTWMTSAAAQGKPSRTVLAERGPLPIADVVRIAQTVAVTLDTLHRNSVIHRDIGTHCIYLDHRSNPPRTTLAGLDNPRRMPTPTPDVTAPEPPLIVHNPSPEHLADKVLTPAADQFSLACTVFELLTGTGPFSRAGSIPGMIVATLQEQPGPLGHHRPDLSDQVEHHPPRVEQRSPTTFSVVFGIRECPHHRGVAATGACAKSAACLSAVRTAPLAERRVIPHRGRDDDLVCAPGRGCRTWRSIVRRNRCRLRGPRSSGVFHRDRVLTGRRHSRRPPGRHRLHRRAGRGGRGDRRAGHSRHVRIAPAARTLRSVRRQSLTGPQTENPTCARTSAQVGSPKRAGYSDS